MIFLGQRLQDCIGKAGSIVAGLPSHYRNRAFIDAQPFIGNHQIHIKFHLIAQAEALRAGAKGVVEGKASWLDFINADSAVRTGEALAEGHGFPVYDIHNKQSVRKRKHAFNGVRKAAFDTLLNHQTIHNDFYIMLDIFIQLDFFRQLIQVSVHSYTDVAASFGAFQHLGMLALPAPYYGRQQLYPGTVGQAHNLIYHLIYRLLFNFLSALGAVGDTDPGI